MSTGCFVVWARRLLGSGVPAEGTRKASPLERDKIASPLFRPGPVLLLLVLSVGTFYVATIRSGQEWPDDFALYILHARNIAEGRAYANTGYIHNPYHPALSPRVYPPVFPLLLAPVYKIFGLNLFPLQIVVISCFLLSLVSVFLAVRHYLTSGQSLALAAILALNPNFWDLKEGILSDLPFLLPTYLSFHFFLRSQCGTRSGRTMLLNALLVGSVTYLAYGTRSIGLLLLPCFVLYDLIKHRRVTIFTLVVVVVVLLARSVQDSIVGVSETAYLQDVRLADNSRGLAQQLEYRLDVIRDNMVYVDKLSDFWSNGYTYSGRLVLFILLSSLAGIGFGARLRKGPGIFELFLPMYVTVLMIWPSTQPVRLLVPILPLYVYYVIVGTDRLSQLIGRSARTALLSGGLALILSSYVGAYSRASWGPLSGVEQPASVRLFQYITANTLQDDVIIFRRPRALALYSGRPASTYPPTASDGRMIRYFADVSASYVILNRDFPDDRRNLLPFLQRNNELFEQVYRDGALGVYRVLQ